MHEVDLPLPNVYYATVTSAKGGETQHLYIAANYNGEAMDKVALVCKAKFGFTPFRGDSSIKLRRFRLQDYLECPQGLKEAVDSATLLGEGWTLEALALRPGQVRNALLVNALAVRDSLGPIDTSAVMEALRDALQQAA
jgi:hypothetical protein